MEMTQQRRDAIDAHVAETHAAMADYAFELNDLVRFALSAAKPKGHKVYYPMDPVNDCIRHWDGLHGKLVKLTQAVAATRERLGTAPFDPEAAVSPAPDA